MNPHPSSFVSLALLVFAGWQAVGSLSRTPALNASLRVEGAQGGSFTGFAPAMYERAEYLHWIASGWSQQGSEARASGDKARAEEAYLQLREISSESLRHSPGDPAAWMHLAQAEAGLGRTASAFDAFERAYELAPNSAMRAVGRLLFLIQVIEYPEARAVATVELDTKMVNADLGLLAEDRRYARLGRLVREQLVAGGLALSPVSKE